MMSNQLMLRNGIFIILFSVCELIAEEALRSDFNSLTRWYEYYKNTAARSTIRQSSLFSLDDFKKILFEAQSGYSDFLDTAKFIDTTAEKFDEDLQVNEFCPFTEKVIVPSECKVFFWGDLHGDIRFLVRSLHHLHKQGLLDDNFNLNEKCFLVFLGDLVDRGSYGAEIVCLLALLRQQNPFNVILIRGNHEHYDQNQKADNFLYEIIARFWTDLSLEEKTDNIGDFVVDYLNPFYNTLPVVVYLGFENTLSFIQCCHGGMEIGYNPHQLFNMDSDVKQPVLEKITSLQRGQALNALANTSIGTTFMERDSFLSLPNNDYLNYGNIGFMWSDFTVLRDQNSTYSGLRGNNIFSYGRLLTQAIIGSYFPYSIVAIIRGHQHNESMPGIFEVDNRRVYTLLWDIPIYTTIATTVIPQSDNSLAATYLELDTTAGIFEDMIMTSWTYFPVEGNTWYFRQQPFLAWQNPADIQEDEAP